MIVILHLDIVNRGESETHLSLASSMWLSGGIRGSVTRSRSVAQEAVSRTKELSSWRK